MYSLTVFMKLNCESKSRKDTLEKCVRLEVVGSETGHKEVYSPASQTLTTSGLRCHCFFKFHYSLKNKW